MRKVTSIFITADDDKKLMVITNDDTEDYFITTGFNNLSQAWDYAKHLAEGYGLDKKLITSRVIEVQFD